jgi:hypothetical protein
MPVVVVAAHIQAQQEGLLLVAGEREELQQLVAMELLTQAVEGAVAALQLEQAIQAEMAAQVLSLSKFPMPKRQPFQAVLRLRYRLRYQDLRFTP